MMLWAQLPAQHPQPLPGPLPAPWKLPEGQHQGTLVALGPCLVAVPVLAALPAVLTLTCFGSGL